MPSSCGLVKLMVRLKMLKRNAFENIGCRHTGFYEFFPEKC